MDRYYRDLVEQSEQATWQEMNAYEEAYRQRLLKGLARKAKELGYQLTELTPAVT